jgi:hypothetical protein
VSLSTSATNCGACGVTCSGGKTCTGGKCKCPTGETDCNGLCVDLDGDRNHCGSCATKCGPQLTCTSGNCVPI